MNSFSRPPTSVAKMSNGASVSSVHPTSLPLVLSPGTAKH